jgi:hypothetical protein
MAEHGELRQDLLTRIEQRRAGVQDFLRENRPSIRRRATVAIVLSSLAAVFTAGPAVGGETFAEGVQKVLGLQSDSYVWRTLCLLAMLVSIGSAIVSNLSKSHEAAVSRLTTAEATKAELEGLSTLLQFGHLSVDDAAKLYHEYTVKIPFIDEPPLVPARSTADD